MDLLDFYAGKTGDEGMFTYINLTQHDALASQVEAGVFEPHDELKNRVRELITFNSIDETEPVELRERAQEIAGLLLELNEQLTSAGLEPIERALIGGAPYFMPYLAVALYDADIMPYYAFTERKSTEKVVDGKTIKTSSFEHAGFVVGWVD